MADRMDATNTHHVLSNPYLVPLCSKQYPREPMNHVMQTFIALRINGEWSIEWRTSRALDEYKHCKVQVIPGSYEIQIIVSPTEIGEFLWNLGLQEYVNAFGQNKLENIDQLRTISGDELKEIGVVAMGHRLKIKDAIKAHFQKAVEVNEVMMRNDDDHNTYIADVAEDMADNNDDAKDIPDVCCDVANYRSVLSREYKYKLMCSVDMDGNPGYTYKMSKQDVADYINNECLPELLGGSLIKPKVKYDALLVALSSHGTLDSIVCSDGKMIAYSTIRQWFQTHTVLRTIPRFYCVDACRVKEANKTKDEMKHSDDDEEEARLIARGKGDAPSATIMGQTEGHIVRGGKVSKYLCKQWEVAKYQSIRILHELFV
eukprot:353243_1